MPAPTSTPSGQRFTGEGDGGLQGPFYLSAGVHSFQAINAGGSNFVVWLADANGQDQQLIFNAIGPYNTSLKQGVAQSGEYYLDVQTADGTWIVGVDDDATYQSGIAAANQQINAAQSSAPVPSPAPSVSAYETAVATVKPQLFRSGALGIVDFLCSDANGNPVVGPGADQPTYQDDINLSISLLNASGTVLGTYQGTTGQLSQSFYVSTPTNLDLLAPVTVQYEIQFPAGKTFKDSSTSIPSPLL